MGSGSPRDAGVKLSLNTDEAEASLDVVVDNLFFFDGNPVTVEEYWTEFNRSEYEVGSTNILGQSEVKIGVEPDYAQSAPARNIRCFNCGDRYHTVPNCPERLNPRLITLSREMHQFYSEDRGLPRSRIVEFEAWKQARLQFLDIFEPGRIQGSALRQALGLPELEENNEDFPWYHEIVKWGYPPGWCGAEDPRDLVRERILNHGMENDVLHEDLIIHNEESSEIVPLRNVDVAHPPSPSSQKMSKRRWARYRTNRFSSNLLPIADLSQELPPLGSSSALVAPLHDSSWEPEKGKDTFTPSRKSLWESILAQRLPSSVPHRSPPPWRAPGAFNSALETSSSSCTTELQRPMTSALAEIEYSSTNEDDMDLSD